MGDSLSPFILSCNDLFNRFHEVALLLLKIASKLLASRLYFKICLDLRMVFTLKLNASELY